MDFFLKKKLKLQLSGFTDLASFFGFTTTLKCPNESEQNCNLAHEKLLWLSYDKDLTDKHHQPNACVAEALTCNHILFPARSLHADRMEKE